MNNGNWKICHLLENRNEQQFTRTQKTGALIALFRTNNSIGKHMPKTEWMSLLLICYYLFRISAAEHSNSRERSNILILNDNNQFRPFWQLNEIVLNSLHTTAKCQLKWGIAVRTPGRSIRWKERELKVFMIEIMLLQHKHEKCHSTRTMGIRKPISSRIQWRTLWISTVEWTSYPNQESIFPLLSCANVWWRYMVRRRKRKQQPSA